jgi:uncharacterized protein YoxC
MNEIIKVCVENGLGIASFIALLYFIFTYVKSLNETMTRISNTMIQMQINMEKMTDRIDKIEEKINIKED